MIELDARANVTRYHSYVCSQRQADEWIHNQELLALTNIPVSQLATRHSNHFDN